MHFLSVLLLFSISTMALAQAPDTPEKDYSAELPRIPSLTPTESKAKFEVSEGFEIALVASEPLVVDPVAFAFDAKGQLWVVEMRDYSEQDTERLGRIAVLRDTDADGVMDDRSTFVENLSWPTAIWPWLDGVIVADAPYLTWHRDTNGNSVADQSEVWYQGFGRSNVQGLVNSFRWGIDGRIHGATSSAGAELKGAGEVAVALGRRDFGLDPITRQLFPETGGGQHGMCFNRWGDKFVTSNSDHLQQIVDIEGWWSHQSNHVALPAVRRSIAEDGPQAEVFRASAVEPWRIVRTRLRISGVAQGIVEGGGRAAGYFTGATGTAVLDNQLGFGLPGETHDTVVVCDVGSNLVHRKRLVDNGFFYTGQRLDQQSELLRSKDIWFRPVQIGEGPDGSLYIADMYREVIEHPASLPPMIKKHLDLTSGRDKGRIWRLSNSSKPRQPIQDFSRMNDSSVVERLSSPIACLRLMASQVLIERFAQKKLGSTTLEQLRSTAIHASSPEARLLSLFLLFRMDGWNAQLANLAMGEKHPRVLAHAIELVEQSHHAKLVAGALLAIAQASSDNRVQLALAKVSAELEPDDRQALLIALLPKQVDPIVRACVATVAGRESWRLLQQATFIDDESYQQWLTLWLPQWASNIATDADLKKFVQDSLTADDHRRTVWLRGLSRVGQSAKVTQLLQASESQSVVDDQVTKSLQQSTCVEAVRWLRLASSKLQAEWLESILNPNSAESLQVACIDSLNSSNHPQLTPQLIATFKSLTPSVQLVALRAIVSRSERIPLLIDGLKSHALAGSQIPTEVRQVLLAHRDKTIAQQFSDLFSGGSSDRLAVVRRYADSIDFNTSDLQTKSLGKQVFQRACAQCHRLGEIGNDVGPPLKQLTDKSPQQLLESILDPSREVDPKYMAYTILLDDGSVLNAIILQENGQQIVVGEAGGKQTTLDRQSIDEMKSSGLSLMPNGFEEQISPQEMSHLIQFLKSP